MAVLDFLMPIVREVGTFLLQRLGNAQSIQFKGRANLVTEMDRRSEDHLIRAIRAQHPDHAILSEEWDNQLCAWPAVLLRRAGPA
jgi:myo-inositol-1(or 4)-monophosphatase